MSEYIHKSHNVTVLMYHFVFPAKYRRAVFDEDVDKVLKEICLDIEQRYQMKFLEIGTDKDHVHFLVQSVPTYSVTKILKKSLLSLLRQLNNCFCFYERIYHVKKHINLFSFCFSNIH